MHVELVTGSRAFKGQSRLWARLDELAGHHLYDPVTARLPFVLMHGAAAAGTDEYAHQWAIHRGNAGWRGDGLVFYEQADPALWTGRDRLAAGHVRNARQVARLKAYWFDGAHVGITVCHYAPSIDAMLEMPKGGTVSQVKKLLAGGFSIGQMTYLGDA